MKRYYHSRKRREIMRKGDDIKHLEVFERDEWVCHICKNLINKHLRGDNWWRATLDHVLPLSRGGTHTWDNVAAAHWICNMEKGNSLITPIGQTG